MCLWLASCSVWLYEVELFFCVNNYYKKFDISLSVLIAIVVFALVQNWSTWTVYGLSLLHWEKLMHCYVISNGYWCQMAAICSCNLYCKYYKWYLMFINTDKVLMVLRDLMYCVPFLFSFLWQQKALFLVIFM